MLDASNKMDSWGKVSTCRECKVLTLVVSGNEGKCIDSWHTFLNNTLKSQAFSSQKAQVQVKSQVTGGKVKVELKVFPKILSSQV